MMNNPPTPATSQPRPRQPGRVRAWIRRHPRWTLVIIGFVLVSIASGICYYLLAQPAPQPARVAQPTPKPKPAEPIYSPLTGLKVPDQAATTQPVTAIMIENSPDARPQSGLRQAGIVYEAIAEGGITRFLALYQQAKPGLIGPVRSLRMYYLDWAAAYDASIAHIGGSAAALSEVRNGNYRDIDQFFNAGSYWRASDRYAPHNVYTSFEKLDALNAAKGYKQSSFTGFARADGKPSATPTASTIDLKISGPLYNIHYDYDAASDTYLRSLGGAPHNDREEGRLAPAVVVALKVDMKSVMEDGYRESIATIGSGGAVVFQHSTATECTWRKADRKSPLEFVDASGKPVALARGQTWISAIPNGSGGVSWQ